MTTQNAAQADSTSRDIRPTINYVELLRLLGDEANPLVAIDGDAVRLSFAFDENHSWVPESRLYDELDDENDRFALEGETFGGRLARPSSVLPALRMLVTMPGFVTVYEDWHRMMFVAEGLCQEVHDAPNSYQDFAELVDDVLLAFQPWVAGPLDSWLEVRRAPAVEGAPCSRHEAATYWVTAELEVLMELVAGPVDAVTLTYPGMGHTAELALVVGDAEQLFTLTWPATEAVVDLVDYHYETMGSQDEEPIMERLNSLAPLMADALLDATEEYVLQGTSLRALLEMVEDTRREGLA